MRQKKISQNIFVFLTVLAAAMLFGAVSVHAAQSAVNLGTAGDFVILSKAGISTTGITSIVGSIGVSPIDSTAITGFGLVMDSSNQFSTSSLVAGKVYASDYTPPTPAKMTTAVSDMQTAYTDAAGRTNPTATELGAGDISGMTIAPGLYKWGTGVVINNGVTLNCQGNANAVYIFQIAQTLTVGSGAIVTLGGGCQAKNIFWQVAGQATLGTTSNFKGNILSQTAIEMNTGATLNGRALAQTAVTLDANAVAAPTGSVTPAPTPTPSGGGSSGGSSSGGSSSSSSGITSQCAEWSACTSEGMRTRTCTQPNGPATTTKQSCTPTQKNVAAKNNSVEKTPTNQGIGQQLNEQIRERKEEIKSGDYTGSLGQLLNVRVLAQNLKELRVNDVSAKTNLTILAETDSGGKTKFKTMLKNGSEKEVKIMPDTASKKALEMLRIKACSTANNCTIQLKDVGSGAAEKIQYEVQLERSSKLFWLFTKKMQVSAGVDAETGVVSVHKPWWAFMAAEPAE